jgi:RNA polymerase sigma factor (sigma-70 family)
VARHQLNLVLQQLRKTIHRQVDPGLADGELLERFVRQRDEAAFEVLVWRHGPLLLSLCRRVLQNSHDAEDVLQAAFLTLVKKAGSIRKRQSLASWLYKVAYRIALRTRTSARKRIFSAAPLEDLPAPPASDSGQELRPVLEAAIEALPEKYRSAVVLAYCQGKSYKEIAEELVCPLGTVATRLASARQMLRKHLARRGIVLAPVALGAALLDQAVSAAVGPPLVSSTVKAATLVAAGQAAAGAVSARVAALTEGMVQSMFLTKAKVMAAVLAACCLVSAGGAVLLQRAAAVAPANLKKLVTARGPTQPSPKSLSRLPALWADLAGKEEARVTRAVLALAVTPKETVAFLKEHLPPLKADPQQVARLLADLDSNRFAVRRKAMADLEYLGKYVKADLTKALAAKPSIEVRRRIQKLLGKLETGQVSPSARNPYFPEARGGGQPRAMEAFKKGIRGAGPIITAAKPEMPVGGEAAPSALWLRAVRAVGVLEHIGTPEARQLLQSLAKGEADAWPTKEAKAALERLNKKAE